MSRIYFVMDDESGARIMRRLHELNRLCLGAISAKVVTGDMRFANDRGWCDPVALFEVADARQFPSRHIRRIENPQLGEPRRNLSVPDVMLEFFGTHAFTAIAVRPEAADDLPLESYIPRMHGNDTVTLHPFTAVLRELHYLDVKNKKWTGPKRTRPSRFEVSAQRRAERIAEIRST